MLNLVWLLAAVALVSVCSLEVQAQLGKKIDIDNSIQPNAVPRRRIRKFVHISGPPPTVMQMGPPGGHVEITCEAMGAPTPSVRWLRNDEVIIDYDEEENEIIATSPNSLARLTSKLITMANPGDIFTCVATAGDNEQTASTRVSYDKNADLEATLSFRKLYNLQPHITAYYNELFQESGSNAILLCRVAGFGKTQVFWSDANDQLIYDNPRMKILPTGDLLINGLRWSDMGQYTCTVKNLYGKESVATFLYPAKRDVQV